MTNFNITEYHQQLDNLSREFGTLLHKTGYWGSDYDLWITEYEAWSVDDMIYIVTNFDSLQSRYEYDKRADREAALRRDIWDWIEYNVDVSQFGIKYINLRSWLAGCPRMSKEQRERLRELRDELDNTIEGLQEEYGRQDVSGQPEHLKEQITNKKLIRENGRN